MTTDRNSTKFSANSRRFVRFAVTYGLRSLVRNKRRTILTIATVALSAGVTIVASRYSTAAMALWAKGSIDTGVGHAQIHARGYDKAGEGLRPEKVLQEAEPALVNLTNSPGISAFAPRISFEGVISYGEETRFFIGTAVDAEKELKTSPALFNPARPGTQDRGQFVNTDQKAGIVLGVGLAKSLGLDIGDEVTLMATTIHGGMNGVDAVITGIIDVPLPSFSKRALYMRLDYAQQFLSMPGQISEVAVRLAEGVSPDKWVAQAKQEFSAATPFNLQGWWEIDPVIRRIENIWNSVLGLISFLMFMSAGLSVLNIIFLLVAERTQEIGTMMAIGAKARDIRIMFCLEGAIIGTFGALAGVTGANIIVLLMGWVGMPLKSPFSAGTFLLHPTPSLVLSATILGGAILVCVLAALAPAEKAASIEPVKAFRGQI